MNRTGRFIAKVIAPALAVLALGGVPGHGRASGGGAGGFAGATEITQILNNVELISQTAVQSGALAQSTQQTLIQLNQYIALLKHLNQLSTTRGSDAATKQQRLAQLLPLLNSITETSTQLAGNLNGNAQDMAAMGMTPQQYLTWMLNQSRDRKGLYAQRLRQELQDISAFEQRYQALQQIQAATPEIDGQVKGLQALNQTMGMATGELMDLRLVVQQQQAALSQQKYLDESSVVAREQKGAQDSQTHSDSLNQFSNAFKGGKAWR